MIPLEVIDTVTASHWFKGFHGCVAARSLFILRYGGQQEGPKGFL